MFIRIISKNEDKETLININSIWKIEVSYLFGSAPITIKDGLLHHSESDRTYTLFFGSESVMLNRLNARAFKVIDDFYKIARHGAS